MLVLKSKLSTQQQLKITILWSDHLRRERWAIIIHNAQHTKRPLICETTHTLTRFALPWPWPGEFHSVIGCARSAGRWAACCHSHVCPALRANAAAAVQPDPAITQARANATLYAQNDVWQFLRADVRAVYYSLGAVGRILESSNLSVSTQPTAHM